MANYSLVINSRFKPFSFERYIQPLQIYGQAYREMEDAYGALGIQAGTVESMLNKELDRDAYNQYQGYMQRLKENADILATQGLNPTLRNSLMNMRNRYSQEIIPIQKAAERREKLADEQRKLGNSRIFDMDAATTGLGEFMNNPTLNYRSIDRTDLLKRSQVQFGQFANELMKFQEDPSKYKDAFHKTLVAQYGFTPDEASQLTAEIATGNITSNDAVARVANNLYNSTGVDAWNNEEAKNAVWSTIAEGAVAGIGKMTPQVIKDEKASKDYEYAKQLELLEKKHELEGNNGKGTDKKDAKGKRFKSRNIRTSDYDTRAPEMVSMLGDLITSIENSSAALWSGTTAKRTPMQQMVRTLPNSTTAYNEKDFENLKKEFDANGVQYYTYNGPNNTKGFVFDNLDELRNLKDFYADRSKYDTYRASQYYRVIDPSQYSAVSAILNGLSTDNTLNNYTIGYGDNGFALAKGNSVPITDGEVSYAEVVTDRDGMDYLSAKIDGQNVIIPMTDIDPSWSWQSNIAKDRLEKYQRTRDEGYTEIEFPDGTKRSITDLINEVIDAKLDEMQLSALQTSKTESQTVKE